jgi:hypothetical protein
MKDTYDEGGQLKGIIYLHQIQDTKKQGASATNLRMLRLLCGMSNLSNVILTTTMWDSINPEVGAVREAGLCSEDGPWAPFKTSGAMVRRYDSTEKTATALVGELLQKSTVILKIQAEVAIEKKKLIHTEAGRSVSEELTHLSKKYEEELSCLKEELTEAMKTSKRLFSTCLVQSTSDLFSDR